MNKYFLQINLTNKNNKKIINNYQLYNNDKLIKEFNDIDVKRINKIIKDYKSKYKLNIDKSENNYKIYDINFLKKHIGIPSRSIIHKNKYVKEIAVLSTLALGFISTSILDHKINPDLYNKSIQESNDDNIDDDTDFIYLEDNNNTIESNIESAKEEIDAPIIYYPEEEDNKNYKIIYYSDDDKNIQENIISTDLVSSENNIYSYSYNYEDRSSSEYVNNIKETYGDCIEKCSKKYGMDPNLIVAMICQENPKSDVNYNSIGGVGLLQVERQIWNNYTMNDIDGNPITINCDEINNISPDYEKMKKVSLYMKNYQNENIDEKNIINYGISEDDILKFHNAEKSIEIGCMIFEYCENQIITNNEKNIYNYKLTPEECELCSIWAHNKGVNQVENCLKNTNSFEETINLIKQTPYGDNEYLEHVISYLPNNTVITMTTRNNLKVPIKLENLIYEETKVL